MGIDIAKLTRQREYDGTGEKMIKRPRIAECSTESFGHIAAQGVTEDKSFEVPVGFEPQFGIVTFSKAYQRNPYWFGSDLRLTKIMRGDTHRIALLKGGGYSIFPWNKTLLIDMVSNNDAVTINPSSYHIISVESDLDAIDLHFSSVSSEIFLLVSEQEDIHADVISVVKSGEIKNNSSTILSKKDCKRWVSDVQVILFDDQLGKMIDRGLYEISVENDKLEVTLDPSIKSFIAVIINDQQPYATIQYPDGFTSNGFMVKHENFPYSSMNLNFRVY